MSTYRLAFGALVCALVIPFSALAETGHDHAAHGEHDHAAHGDTGHGTAHDHAAHDSQGHSDTGHAAHGDAAHGDAAHGHDSHDPTFADINWMYGLLGERPDVEPSLMYRPVGMPAPVGAMLINSGILFFVLFRMGRGPVKEALKKRKQTILQGFEEAGQMKATAGARLAEYEAKLAKIDEEIARVRTQMREAAELERKRVLQEANERCERMARDAQLLIEQELKAAREELLRETAKKALKSAEALINAQLNAGDKERLLQDYLTTLSKNASQGMSAKGGQA
jgi:F0F1-type ATP synthase membrane subunit b/b'